ncbi:hypothetical protein [Chthonomonas calidirosea]|uniref:hypothetical protein n=1 Tax=Chthonomonas calidirosea TaxID=454171 RepID=UPI0006EC7118|nr:hypothetical protein [Chthonomonas calidirosea]CEK18155.1 hypothetical protein CP488_02086 [Chthonomonas calidirosea]
MATKKPVTPTIVAARRKTLYAMCFASILFGVLCLLIGSYLLSLVIPPHVRSKEDLFTLAIGIGMLLFGLWRLGLAFYYLRVLRKTRSAPSSSSQQQT